MKNLFYVHISVFVSFCMFNFAYNFRHKLVVAAIFRIHDPLGKFFDLDPEKLADPGWVRVIYIYRLTLYITSYVCSLSSIKLFLVNWKWYFNRQQNNFFLFWVEVSSVWKRTWKGLQRTIPGARWSISSVYKSGIILQT